MDDEIRDAVELLRAEVSAWIDDQAGPMISRDRMLDQVQQAMMELTGQPCLAAWDQGGRSIRLVSPVFNYEAIR